MITEVAQRQILTAVQDAQLWSQHTGAINATLGEVLNFMPCSHCQLSESKDANDPYYRILTVLIEAGPEGIGVVEIAQRAAIIDHRKVPRLMADMYSMNVAKRTNRLQRTTRSYWEPVGCTCNLPF